MVKPVDIGRNDPCPCGTGKKYKRCCLERETGTKQFRAPEKRRTQRDDSFDDLPTMSFFMEHFREVAKRETRHMMVANHDCLPSDQYVFFELYCTKPGCPCRNVVFNVTGRKGGHLATINHSLDPNGFKDIDMPRTFLDPLNKQSRYSKALLHLFLEDVLDEVYSLRLEQHLKMMKEKFS